MGARGVGALLRRRILSEEKFGCLPRAGVRERILVATGPSDVDVAGDPSLPPLIGRPFLPFDLLKQ